MTVRSCDVCHQFDDHPRHPHFLSSDEAPNVPSTDRIREAIAAGMDDKVLTEFMHPQTQDRHLDCCAAAGCPGGSCDRTLAAGAAGLKGDDLRNHITGSV